MDADKCVVLIDAYQILCCGDEEFEVGDNIKLHVEKWESYDSFAYPDAEPIDYYYEHLSTDYMKLISISGKVSRIDILYCVFIDDPENPGTSSKIRSEGMLKSAKKALVKEKDIGQYWFDGYVVCLDNVRVETVIKGDADFLIMK